MNFQYNPLARYGFDAVGGGNTPSQSVDVISKVKEEISRSSAEMSYILNHSYKRYLEVLDFRCVKAFGLCTCNFYIQVEEDFVYQYGDPLVILDHRGIFYPHHAVPTYIYSDRERTFVPASGTDAVYLWFENGGSFNFKKYDLIAILNSFNYTER